MILFLFPLFSLQILTCLELNTATELLQRFGAAIILRDTSLISRNVHDNYQLTTCGNSRLNKLKLLEAIENLPMENVTLYQFKIEKIEENRNSIFNVRTTIDGFEVVFDVVKQQNGKYLLLGERDYNCAEKNSLSTMLISYPPMAKAIAKSLIRKYIRAISERSYPKFWEIAENPYILYGCADGIDDRNVEFHSYQLNFPGYHINQERTKNLVEIRNAQFREGTNLALEFSVHGGGFNNFFHATRDENNIYKIKYDQLYTCSETLPTKLNYNEIQYAAVKDD